MMATATAPTRSREPSRVELGIPVRLPGGLCQGRHRHPGRVALRRGIGQGGYRHARGKSGEHRQRDPARGRQPSDDRVRGTPGRLPRRPGNPQCRGGPPAAIARPNPPPEEARPRGRASVSPPAVPRGGGTRYWSRRCAIATLPSGVSPQDLTGPSSTSPNRAPESTSQPGYDLVRSDETEWSESHPWGLASRSPADKETAIAARGAEKGIYPCSMGGAGRGDSSPRWQCSAWACR